MLSGKQKKLYKNTDICGPYGDCIARETGIAISHSDKTRSGSWPITSDSIKIIFTPTRGDTMNVLRHSENSVISSQSVTFDSIQTILSPCDSLQAMKKRADSISIPVILRLNSKYSYANIENMDIWMPEGNIREKPRFHPWAGKREFEINFEPCLWTPLSPLLTFTD